MLEQETENKPRTKFLQMIKRITFSPTIFFGSVCCVFLMLILILHYPKQPKQPMFDYKVVSFLTNGNDRTGSGAVRYSTINISENDLMILGVQGWVVFPFYQKGWSQVRHLNTFNGLQGKARHSCVTTASPRGR